VDEYNAVILSHMPAETQNNSKLLSQKQVPDMYLSIIRHSCKRIHRWNTLFNI